MSSPVERTILRNHAKGGTMKTPLVIARQFAIAAALIAAGAAAQADNRFPVLTPDQMTPEQAKLVQALLAGPRGGGDAGPEAVGAILKRGPFNSWLRSPELRDRLETVCGYVRVYH